MAAQEWQNWSGSVTARPDAILHPEEEEAVATCVRSVAKRGGTLRVAGSGHSHAPLVATDDTLLVLDRIAGIEHIDREARTATIRAGSVLSTLGEPLRAHGLAMENLGDVDVQALAGAIATGTHGTGRTLGSLSTQIEGLRFVVGNGSLRTLSRKEAPDLFSAARVALGALGVVTAVTLRLVPAYRLHERILRESVDDAVTRFEERAQQHRHSELFWYPSKDVAEVKLLDATDAPPDPLPDRPYERIDHSHRVLPSIRDERHVELEYNVPAEVGLEAFLAVRACMQQHHPEVRWPVELRSVAEDDIPLSPATGRPGMTVSVHQGRGLPYQPLFDDAEDVLRGFGGRPHWGKCHGQTAESLRPLYPQWEAFQRARAELDPGGVFSNDALRALLDR
jgi:FAD/FMN-containing dehydrogenase